MAEYKRLFNTTIEHTFYTDGISRDFDIVPSPETDVLLKQNRLVFRNDSTGFRLLYQNLPGSNNPFIAFGGFNLTFLLELKNLNGFQNITDLTEPLPGPDKSFTSGNLVYFANINQTGNSLNYSIVDFLKPTSFTYEFPQTGGIPADNGQLVITNEASVNVTPTSPNPNAVKADPSGKFSYPIDFSSLPAGLYTFTSTVNGINPAVKKIYIDNSLVRKPIFGLIKIKVVDWDDFPASRIYRARFVRREAKWQYKMVLKTTDISIADTLGIVDDLAVYTFTKKPDELTNGFPTAVFDSNAKIAFTQVPRKKFRFVKNPGVGEIIILNNLSNPPTNMVSSSGNDFSTSVIYITV